MRVIAGAILAFSTAAAAYAALPGQEVPRPFHGNIRFEGTSQGRGSAAGAPSDIALVIDFDGSSASGLAQFADGATVQLHGTVSGGVCALTGEDGTSWNGACSGVDFIGTVRRRGAESELIRSFRTAAVTVADYDAGMENMTDTMDCEATGDCAANAAMYDEMIDNATDGNAM